MMKNVKKLVLDLHRDEQGDIVQTGIVLGVMAVIALGAMMFLREPIARLFGRASDEIDAAAEFESGF